AIRSAPVITTEASRAGRATRAHTTPARSIRRVWQRWAGLPRGGTEIRGRRARAAIGRLKRPTREPIGRDMGRRLAVPCALATLLVFVPVSAAKAPGSWAQPQIQAVVGAGIMGTDVASFHPDGPLTRIALEQLVAGLTHTAPALVANPTATVTITNLDARLVNALALNDTAKLFHP